MKKLTQTNIIIYMNENTIKYRNNWRDTNYKRFELIVPKSEHEVIEKLDSVANRAAYITELVKADLKKEN